MKTSDFYFDLPQELIAQDPLEDRSSSRLLVLDRESGKTQHRVFRDIIEYLNQYDDYETLLDPWVNIIAHSPQYHGVKN